MSSSSKSTPREQWTSRLKELQSAEKTAEESGDTDVYDRVTDELWEHLEREPSELEEAEKPTALKEQGQATMEKMESNLEAAREDGERVVDQIDEPAELELHSLSKREEWRGSVDTLERYESWPSYSLSLSVGKEREDGYAKGEIWGKRGYGVSETESAETSTSVDVPAVVEEKKELTERKRRSTYGSSHASRKQREDGLANGEIWGSKNRRID